MWSLIPNPLVRFLSSLLIIALLCLGLIVFAYGLFQVLKPPSDPITLEKTSGFRAHTAATSIAPTQTEIMVDVRGGSSQAVCLILCLQPLVSTDGITATGGLSSKADHQALAKGINLAAHLMGSAWLYIPFQGEQASLNSSSQAVAGAVQVASLSIMQQAVNDGLPGVGPVTSVRSLVTDHILALRSFCWVKSSKQECL